MDYKKTTRDTYDSISSNWEIKRRYYWKPVVDFLKKQENKEHIVLADIGCGTGRHLELAEELGFEKENLIGVDFSKGQLEIVKEKGYRINQSDMENLDMEDCSIDVIISIAAHHHLLENSAQLGALEEMKRVLKQCGKILLSNWFPEEEFVEKQLEKGKFEFLDGEKQKVKVTYTHEGKQFDRYYYLFKKDELEALCKKAKLKIVDEIIFKGNLYLELEKAND